MGLDWHETLHQIANEEEELKALNLTRVVSATGKIADDPSDPGANDTAAAGAAGADQQRATDE
jgi:hypothetical protein